MCLLLKTRSKSSIVQQYGKEVMITMEATIVLAVIYISVILSFKNLDELALFSCWLLFTLLKRSFNLGHIVIPFIGLCGVVFSRCQSRQSQFDEIDAFTTTMILHLLILSTKTFLIPLEQMYGKLKNIYKNNSVCMKLFLIHTLTATMIIIFMCMFCHGIDLVQVWINTGPLNTNNNYVTIQGKLHGFMHNVVISDGDLASTYKIFSVDEHQSLLYSHGYYFHKAMSSLPLTKHHKEIFPGEKAELTCSFRVKLADTKHLYSLSLFFAQDSIEVRHSPRRSVQLPEEKIQNGSSYTFSLTLFDIQSYDFGIYRAGLRIIIRLGSSCSVSSATMYQYVLVKEDYACVFNLSRIVDYYEYVDVPVGALLTFRHLYLQSDSDYLRVEHYVNGIPINIISNISSDCCLPSVLFWMEVWNLLPLILPSISMTYEKFMHNLEVRAWVCACSSLYGIHRFKFYNNIYDFKQKIWITSEFWHPHITVVYPKSSNLPWNSISERESRLIDPSKNKRNFSLFEGSAFEILQSNIDDDFVVMKYIEFSLILGVVFIIICVGFVSLFAFLTLVSALRRYAHEQLGLLIKVKLPDTGGNLANVLQIRDTCQNYHHDVFVLNVDDDRTFVIDELYPVFADKQLSVFLSEEDLPPGFIIENLNQALIKSKKVIVVVSDSFINDRFYNSFFLPHIVLRRLDQGLIASRHLMLLVSEPCRVPTIFIHDDRIVTLDYTRNPRDIFLRKLNKWLESPVIREGFGEQPMLHSDLLQLYQA